MLLSIREIVETKDACKTKTEVSEFGNYFVLPVIKKNRNKNYLIK